MKRPDPYKPLSIEVDQLDIRLTQWTPPSTGFWISKLVLEDGFLNINFQNPEHPEYRQSSIAELELNRVDIELSFLDQDRLRLDRFHADFLGTPIELTGWIENASSLRAWRRPPSKKRPISIQALQWIREIKALSFLSQNPIHGYFLLDAKTPVESMARLEWSCQGVGSRLGYLDHGAMSLRIMPAERIEPDGDGDSEASSDEGSAFMEVDFKLELGGLEASDYGNLASLSWTLHGAVNASLAPGPARNPLNTGKQKVSEKSSDPVASVPETELEEKDPQAEKLREAVERALEIMDALTWDGHLALEGLDTRWLKIGKAQIEMDWMSPILYLRPLEGELYEGRVAAELKLDTRTRQLSGSAEVDFDGRRLAPLLTPQGKQWFSQFDWDHPPKVKGVVGLTLPELTGKKPDWQKEVRPTITIAGDFQAGYAKFRGAPVLAGEGSFSLTNSVWRLPDLVAHRPEGDFTMNLTSSMDEHSFEWTMRSEVYPNAMLPLLDNPEWHEAREALMDLDFNPGGAPPIIEGRVAGWWREPERLELDLQVETGPMRFRGMEASRLELDVFLENQKLNLTHLEWEHPDGAQWAQVPSLTINIPEKSILFNDAQGVIYPEPLLVAIGPEPAEFVEPYTLRQPVQFDVQGLLKWKELENTDMKFDLKIPASREHPWKSHSTDLMEKPRQTSLFGWWKLNADEVQGHVHWDGLDVRLDHWSGNAYQGSFSGGGEFTRDLEKKDTRFKGDVHLERVQLGSLMEDIIGQKKDFAGDLRGDLKFEDGWTSDNRTWRGRGWTELRHGLVWDIPIFGFVSQMLNTLSPGIGNSRATEAKADFIFENGYVETDNLQIQAKGFALDYRGKAWYDGAIDAKAQAALLNDIPVGGDLLSFALSPMTKLFEYKITGSLNQPVANPLYLPKWILAPLTPIRSVKGIVHWINPWDQQSRDKKFVTPLDLDSGVSNSRSEK